MPVRKANAEWKGGLRDGNGTISTETGTFKEFAENAKAGCPVSRALTGTTFVLNAKLKATS